MWHPFFFIVKKKHSRKSAKVFEFPNGESEDLFLTPKGVYVFQQVVEFKRDFDEAIEEFDLLFNEDGTPKLSVVSKNA